MPPVIAVVKLSRMITVVAQKPLATAEQHEMVGIGMDVTAARIVRETVHGLVAEEWPALEDQERFVSRPSRARSDDPHVLEVVQRG